MLLSKARHKRTWSSSRNEPCEDGITSAVFSPLRAIPGTEGWTLLCQALFGANVPEDFPTGANLSQRPNFLFWPSLPDVTSVGNRVEPDLVVDASLKNGTLFRLIIEVKWDAGESGERQLERQWRAFSRDRCTPEQCFLVYLVKHYESDVVGSAEDQDRRQVSFNGRFRLITWREVVRNSTQGFLPGPDSEWPGDTARFLTSLGIRPFVGIPHAIGNTSWKCDSKISWSLQPYAFSWLPPSFGAPDSFDQVHGWNIFPS